MRRIAISSPRFTRAFLFALFAVCFTVQTFATTYTVTDVTDGHNTNQLRGAIEAADAAGGGPHIINVAAGTYTLTLGEIKFGNRAENISIAGAGASQTIISMTGNTALRDRIFFINPPADVANVITSITGITFSNGYLTSDRYGGGAIACGGPNNSISLTNCVFTNNTVTSASNQGGGAVIISGGGTFIINGCTFSGNTCARVLGGAVLINYTNLAGYSINATVTNAVFSGNNCTGDRDGTAAGGAMAIIAAGTNAGPNFNVSVLKNTFVNNTVSDYGTGEDLGGAIYIDASGTVNVNYNRFSGNKIGTKPDAVDVSSNHTGAIDATNNWWGCNDDPRATSACAERALLFTGGSSTFTTEPRLLLRTSLNASTICQNLTPSTGFTASFLTNSTNTTVSAANLTALIGLPVSYTVSNGAVSGTQNTIQANGTVTGTFTGNAGTGAAAVTAVVDNITATDAYAKAVLTVSVPPTIATAGQPAAAQICSGGTASFAVAPTSASALTYQWYKGTAALTNGTAGSGAVIQGATTANLSITGAVAIDAALYKVVATNACGSATSNTAALKVYGSRLYVAGGSTGSGSSWADALGSIDDAINIVNAGSNCVSVKEIWVKTGTYIPSAKPYGAATTDDRDKAFVLLNGITLCGGFDGTETTLSQRNINANPTILSGNIGDAANNRDNCYHIVVSAGNNNTAVLDGFTISGGWPYTGSNNVNVTYAGVPVSRALGGGISLTSSSAQIVNCTITGNLSLGGGGVYQNGGNVKIANCVLTNNSALTGGGVQNENNPVLAVSNSVFSGNTSSSFGAAASLYGGKDTIVNCLFIKNADAGVTQGGGAINTNGGNYYIVNNIFYGDSTKARGGAIYAQTTSDVLQAYNNIFYKNYAATGSADVYVANAGNYTQANNSFGMVNPLFINESNLLGADNTWGTNDDGLNTMLAGPAFNAGNNSKIPTGITTDITGVARVQNGTVNLGAYENAYNYTTVYVDSSIAIAGDGGSWATAFKTLSNAVAVANSVTTVNTIVVAKGTYYPTGNQNGTDRAVFFNITRSGLKIYGGYPAGGGTRNTKVNPTTLSGDIGVAGNNADNSYHVININTITTTQDSLVFDGFTITGGNANGAANNYGYGGAVLATGNSTSIIFNNLVVVNNNALMHGGGICASANKVISVSGSMFTGNVCGKYGGGFYSDGTNAASTVVNCAFNGNQATGGGGVYSYDGTINVINSTLYANIAAGEGAGGGIGVYQPAGKVSNSIVWGNVAAVAANDNIYNYSVNVNFFTGNNLIQNGAGGANPANPQFVNSANPIGSDGVWGTGDDGLQLQKGSPAIDAGANSAVPAGVTVDIKSADRIINNLIDIGAYEYQYPYTTLYVDSSIATGGDGGSWATAFKTMSDAITAAQADSNVTAILAAKGTYYPTGSQSGTNRDSAFTILRGGLKIYGGYPAGGGIRNPAGNPTILSGDIGVAGDSTDNSCHLVVITGISATADTLVLDGFTITRGNASLFTGHTYGNLAIAQSNGGGIYIINNSNKIVLNNLVIANNSAANAGGGIDVNSAQPVISNTVFTGNAAWGNGAGLFNESNAVTTTVNSIFIGNWAFVLGAGAYNTQATINYINCIMYANRAWAGGSSLFIGSGCNGKVANCIAIDRDNGTPDNMYDGSGLAYSNNMLANGANQVDINALVLNAANPAGADGAWGTIDDGFQLKAGSPAINAGSNSAVPAWLQYDITGATRIVNGIVNMGPYESWYQSKTLYVDSSVAVKGDGNSWARAFKTMSDAVKSAHADTTYGAILVAKGTYYPTGSQSGTDRDSAFTILRGGLKIYGGYPAGGGIRNSKVNPTVLSGNIGDTDDSTDNSYHVMVIAGIPATQDSLVIDGFTVTKGNANSSTGHIYGTSNLAQTNGAGIYVAGNGNKIAFNQVIVSNNNASNVGGGLDVNGSEAIIANSVITGNTSSNGGPAMYIEAGANITAVNTIVAANTESLGAVINDAGTANFINCTMYGNLGAAILNRSNAIGQVANCILWGNGSPAVIAAAGSSITYGNNVIQAGAGGGLNADPLFVNTADPVGPDGIWGTTDDGLQPQAASQAIDAGDNSAVPAWATTDITGVARILGPTVNLGAYESGFIYTKIYVDSSIAVAGNGTSWDKAFKTLSDATAVAQRSGTSTTTIFVAKGTYYTTGSQNATNRDSAFIISRGGLKMYGGYPAGGGTRNVQANPTILSGNIGASNDSTDNSYHVMVITGLAAGPDSLILDGLTVTSGFANGSGNYPYAAIQAERNNGSGMYVSGNSNTMVYNNIVVTGNYALNNGGGLYFSASQAIVTNSVVASNISGVSGGGVYVGGNITFINTLFVANRSNSGAALTNISTANIINCTLAGNASSVNGAAMFSAPRGTGQLTNSIVWGNVAPSGYQIIGGSRSVTFSHNILQNGNYLIGNTGTTITAAASPLFKDSTNYIGPDGMWGTADDGLQLQTGSPAIDAGANSAVPAWVTHDVRGVTRIINSTVDIGAYEQTGGLFTWTGAQDLYWENPNNWSTNAVPTAADDVLIPVEPVNQPVIFNISAVHNITNNGYLLMYSTGSINITGNVVNNNSFLSDGTLIFNGTQAQTINGHLKLFSITVNNIAGLSILSGTTRVIGTYTPQAGVLNSNGHLVLGSELYSTANVASAGSNINYITGNVTVERYIPRSHRAWRLLTAPLSHTGSIYENWQNNGVPDADISTGADIFRPGGGGGYTAAGVAASIKSYDSPADAWVGLPNTNVARLGEDRVSAANNPYGLFITGPYGSGHIASGFDGTTLRATGQLQTGTQTFIYPGVAAGRYLFIGNPYASPIDFATMEKNHVANTLWTWDAQLSALGAYVMFSYDNVTGTYDQDVAEGVSQQTTAIQSGQAFFVQSLGDSSAAGVTIRESDKTTGNINNVFFAPTTGDVQQLRVTLNKEGQGIDGILLKLGGAYKQGLSDDGSKLFGYNENISIKVDTSYLGIERMPLPKENDSLWLDVWGMKAKTSYSFTFAPQNIPVKVKAYLLDRFLNAKTPIDLAITSDIAYTTTADKNSYAEDRFVIVFAQAGVLASTGTTVKAWQQDDNVQVQWITSNEQDIQQYVVESSADGQYFTAIQSNIPPRNTGKTETYTSTGKQPATVDNYYRIRVVNKDGRISYSNVVKVSFTKGKAAISVYPNPVVRTEQLHITMANMNAGKYTIKLFSSDGKQVIQQATQYDGRTATQSITLPASIAAGSYRLLLLDENGNTWKQQVVIQ